jgi:hypothetical protein
MKCEWRVHRWGTFLSLEHAACVKSNDNKVVAARMRFAPSNQLRLSAEYFYELERDHISLRPKCGKSGSQRSIVEKNQEFSGQHGAETDSAICGWLCVEASIPRRRNAAVLARTK